MKKSEQKASLKISQEVMEKIATVTASEVDGVNDIVIPENNIKGIFSSNLIRKPVEVKVNGGTAEVSIAISLDFGVKIDEVCKEVQRAIKDNVQTMTGVVVSKVNISVENINLPKVSKQEVPAE